ncbi:hypothetical protein [Flavisolibacter nicotianae]|uniref:hypothetical protein n=1 Tax=Flavisolibacter nicotianae TaxID=2364882 RepID=UPI000EAC6BB8|nr:hypothetical protein [Flavisolibacter nicotianae]
MKQKRNVLALAALAIVFAYSCSKDNGTNGTNSPGNTGGQTGPLFNAVRDVLGSNCALSGCHAGSSPQNGIDFNNSATIVAQANNIKARAVDQAGTATQMPPPPRQALSAADRKKITDWVNAGGRASD